MRMNRRPVNVTVHRKIVSLPNAITLRLIEYSLAQRTNRLLVIVLGYYINETHGYQTARGNLSARMTLQTHIAMNRQMRRNLCT